MRINRECPVSITSFNDDLCTNIMAKESSSDNTKAIIGGVVAVVLIVVAAIVIISALVWRSCHKKLSVKKAEE